MLLLHLNWLKKFVHIHTFVQHRIIAEVKKFVKLEAIAIHCRPLDTKKELGKFICYEIAVALWSSFLITLAWMSLYFIDLHVTVAFVVTALTLAYTARRWHLCEQDDSNRFLVQLRMAKMLFTITCTMFCLLMILSIFLQSSEVEKALTFFMFGQSWGFITPFAFDSLQINNEIPATIFLFALESVLITDIASNLVKMTMNKDFLMALNYEAPVLSRCGLQIIIGAWTFNILGLTTDVNGALLLTVLILCITTSWIDAGFFNIEIPIPRPNDFFGHQLMKDINWTDINVAAFGIAILAYSQWKFAPNLVYPEEISLAQYILSPRIIRKIFKVAGNESVEVTQQGPDAYLLVTMKAESDRMEVTSEVILTLIVTTIFLRFRRNFGNTCRHRELLTNTRWLTHIVPMQIENRRIFNIPYDDDGEPFPLLRFEIDNLGNIQHFLHDVLAVAAQHDENGAHPNLVE